MTTTQKSMQSGAVKRVILRCLLAMLLVSLWSPSAAYAAAVLEERPFWTGTPPGGYYQECAGLGVYATAYYVFSPGTAYGETKYSSGGYCNNWLNRPSQWIKVFAYSQQANGTICAQGTAYNANNFPNVHITTGTCGGTMKYTYGSMTYQHPSIPHPLGQLLTIA